jgi:mono/diheme cytochrome c family protein
MAVALPGCRGDRSTERPHEFLPDMDNSPKWKPQVQSDFYADRRTMRPPVDGTVAYGRWGFASGETWAIAYNQQRDDLLREGTAVYQGKTGVDAEGKPIYVERIPIPVDEALIARGQERFNIYCSACHGYAGDGKGAVGLRWATPVANLHDPKYRDRSTPDNKWSDGFIFYTALHGVPSPDGSTFTMPPYAHALSERDAWAVVSYVRVLQATGEGRLEDVPADQRDDLIASRAGKIAAQEKAEAAAAAALAAQPAATTSPSTPPPTQQGGDAKPGAQPASSPPPTKPGGTR